MVTALTTAQTLFSVALSGIVIIVTWFIVYMLWSTMWSDRWVRKGRSK